MGWSYSYRVWITEDVGYMAIRQTFNDTEKSHMTCRLRSIYGHLQKFVNAIDQEYFTISFVHNYQRRISFFLFLDC